MDTIMNWITGNPTDTIAMASLLVAAAALIYEARVKKFELTYQYYSDVLAWHDQVVEVLISLKLNATEKGSDKADLIRLSSLIETGRFYFPNLIYEDEYGSDKPIAYRGYRNCVLDFLVYAYRLFDKEDCAEHLEHAEALQRLFTSHVFEYLNPKKHQKRIYKRTMFKCAEEMTIEEFLEKSPKTIYTLFLFDDNKNNWMTRPTQREKSKTDA